MSDLPARSALRKRLVRFLWILLVGGILFLGILAFLHLAYARPIGTGPAGPMVPHEAFAKSWSDRKVLLLGVGDSVTAGFGVPTAYSYFNRLAKNLADEFEDLQGVCLSAVLPNLRTENIALSGSTSIAHLDIIRERLKTQDSETFGLVVMTSGGNDLIHNYGRTPPREGAMYGATLQQARLWIENFEERLEEMLDLLKDRFPGGCMIFLADIYDPTDGVGDAPMAGLPSWSEGVAVHQAYNEIIHRCAGRRRWVHVVPMYGEFLGHGIHCTQPWRSHYRSEDPHYWYAWNLEDPNIRGYDAIRRLFLIAIAEHAGEFPSRMK